MSGSLRTARTSQDAAQEIAERLWLASKLKVLSPRSSFGINDAVEAALFLTDRMFRQAAVTVQRELGAETALVDASMGHVEQALANVLTNACEATKAGGMVRVETRIVPAAGVVEVCVRDSGVGIPADSLGKVFLPFFGTKGRLGIGLTVARDLLWQWGGGIRIESEPAGGTRVFMRLPAAARL